MGIQPRRRREAPPGREFTHDAPAHILSRPSWVCGCGEPWPCEPKRAELLADCAEAPTALHMFMSAMLGDAIEDLDVPAGELWMRFLGWVRAGTRHPASDPGTP